MQLRIIAAAALLLAAVGLGFLAWAGLNARNAAQQAQVQQQGPIVATENVVAAAHALPAGTLARDSDFTEVRLPVAQVPADAIRVTKDAIVNLRGALIRKYVDAGTPLSPNDILRPRDRGFLAAVLSQGMRAVSIAVDAVTGVSGLIWPGGHVDVLLTQHMNVAGAPLAESVFSETVLRNVRVIAIDQKIVQGATGNAATAAASAGAQVYRTVTLEVSPPQAEKIAVAERLGALSLAMRPASEEPQVAKLPGEEVHSPATMFASGVSPALARAEKPVGARMKIIQGAAHSEVKFP